MQIYLDRTLQTIYIALYIRCIYTCIYACECVMYVHTYVDVYMRNENFPFFGFLREREKERIKAPFHAVAAIVTLCTLYFMTMEYFFISGYFFFILYYYLSQALLNIDN